MTSSLPPSRPLDVVVLAAGAGTRMKSTLPKMLHQVCGRPMVAWAVKVAQALEARDIVVVTGHGAEQVEAALGGMGLQFVRQHEQLGTGHAFLLAAQKLRGGADVLVLYGDSPMIRPETLQAMRAEHQGAGNALTVLTSQLSDATGYGRIVRGKQGDLERIVEQKAATPTELSITEFNSGVYLMDERAGTLAGRIGNDNPAKEYYLTDLVQLYRQEGARVAAFNISDPSEVMGANDRVQLAELETLMRRRINEGHMRAGVTLQDPATTLIESDVQIARDVVLEQGVVLRGNTSVQTGVRVGAYSVVTDSQLAQEVTIKSHSVLEGAVVGEGSTVGPFARLRPGAVLAEEVHVGNFVEVKNTQLARGVKAGHLAYLGDASIGQESNIGAGTITANFDGLEKHRTTIGAGAFIGSNTTLIAPVTVADGGFVAGGSAINQDVPAGSLAVARAQQRNIARWAVNYWRKHSADKLSQRLPWLSAWLSKQE